MSSEIRIRQRTRPPAATGPAAEPPATPVSASAAVPITTPPAAPTSKADYDVGYGKPPRGRPFEPGHSGNPKGRPKGSQNFHTLIAEALNEHVKVRENGREKLITKRQVGATRFANKVAEGDPKTMAMWIKMFGSEGGAVGPAPRTGAQVAEPDEQPLDGADVLDELLAMARRSVADRSEQR